MAGKRNALRLPWLLALLAGSTAGAQTVHPNSGGGSALFLTADQCIACHSDLTDDAGRDVSIGYAWRASMMANSARDPYWRAGVRREIADHPEAQAAIEDTCATCHMPMARFDAMSNGVPGTVFASARDPLALDGVSCSVCHQILDDNFGELESFDGGFEIDTSRPPGERAVFGPHDVDLGRQTIMQSATQFLPTQSTHLQASDLCATCHTLYTHALVGPGETSGALAEQVPYLEWLHSDYRETQSCQDCHMPELRAPTPISSVLGEPRPAFSQHDFRGGNAFMLRILNKYRGELDVTALPQELDAAAERTDAYLAANSARISIGAERVDGVLTATIAIDNLAGHKLPTAYPSRRVWLHVTVTDDTGSRLFESGALRPNGSIVGNDNDTDGARYEPHYRRISETDQVQIYESVLVDNAGLVTTGLLSAVRYIKDNRLLPRGFDKSTAGWDIAVIGSAVDDSTFLGSGDAIQYVVDVGEGGGPLTVTAELNYQAIGFRWAENLKHYEFAETQRFSRYYAETAQHSAARLAIATLTL
jgi:hypothetical protein